MRQGADILVVDDEPAVRWTIKNLLEYCGHKVGVVDGGEAALAALAERRFQVVITDFSMPGMRGDQLVARIRQQLPTLPIIMVTAFADDLVASGQRMTSVDALLPKPFSFDELTQAIERVLVEDKAECQSVAVNIE